MMVRHSVFSSSPFDRAAIQLLLIVASIVAAFFPGQVANSQSDDSSALPMPSTDQIVVRKDGATRTRTVSGTIEDISGQTIVLRRPGNTVDVVKLRDVVTLRFQKSAGYDEGLRRIRERDWKSALPLLKAAAASEPRKWVVREIYASTAETQRALGQFEECLTTIENILTDDPDSRHVVELPLVWDERLSPQQRIALKVEDLNSRSPARQLCAASALLHDQEHQPAAIASLQTLKQTRRGVFQQLTETQLWRIRLLQPDALREAEINQWSQQAKFFDRRTRSGPEFIIGRALLQIHDYDNAATSLLWMPLLEPLDPPTTAASLADAITALEMSGRTMEAARLRIEIPPTLPQQLPANK